MKKLETIQLKRLKLKTVQFRNIESSKLFSLETFKFAN